MFTFFFNWWINMKTKCWQNHSFWFWRGWKILIVKLLLFFLLNVLYFNTRFSSIYRRVQNKFLKVFKFGVWLTCRDLRIFYFQRFASTSSVKIRSSWFSFLPTFFFIFAHPPSIALNNIHVCPLVNVTHAFSANSTSDLCSSSFAVYVFREF